MKWFKHFTDSDKSESISTLIGKEGITGYGRWFRLLEIVASRMERGSDRCDAEYPMAWWCEKLQASPMEAWKFFKTCEALFQISVQTDDQTAIKCRSSRVQVRHMTRSKIRVVIPNLLKRRDEYCSKSGQNRDKIGTK